jgi:glutathione S-transferase
MKLIHGDLNYSSWSMRPWLVLTHFGIPFDAELARLSGKGWRENIRAKSPSGKVPVLIDGDLVVPETIAIIEYLADKFSDKDIWPKDRKARALARAAAAEMHAGFNALRNAAPTNLRASKPGRIKPEEVEADLRRVEKLWSDLLQRFGGPYLFGAEFGGADAMFAPLASRIRTYELAVSDTAQGYVEAIYSTPAFQELLRQAIAEPYIVERDEIDILLSGRPPQDDS